MRTLSFGILAAASAQLVTAQEWELLFQEDFSNPLPQTAAQWVLEDYSNLFDTVMEDNGM